jgi:hypothetical protein
MQLIYLFLHMAVFWVVAPCSLVVVYRRFRRACLPPSTGRYVSRSRRNNPKDSHLHTAVRTSSLTVSALICHFFSVFSFSFVVLNCYVLVFFYLIYLCTLCFISSFLGKSKSRGFLWMLTEFLSVGTTHIFLIISLGVEARSRRAKWEREKVPRQCPLVHLIRIEQEWRR